MNLVIPLLLLFPPYLCVVFINHSFSFSPSIFPGLIAGISLLPGFSLYGYSYYSQRKEDGKGDNYSENLRKNPLTTNRTNFLHLSGQDNGKLNHHQERQLPAIP